MFWAFRPAPCGAGRDSSVHLEPMTQITGFAVAPAGAKLFMNYCLGAILWSISAVQPRRSWHSYRSTGKPAACGSGHGFPLQ